MNDLSNLEVASSYYPNEIIESSSSTTLATGTDTYSDTTTTVSMRSGIGFEVKGGVEYKDIFRFEGVIGQKRIMIEDVDTSYTNSDGDFYTLEDDEEIYIMLNYFGLNTYFELARGIKVISPFFGVGAGGVFPSTSGLGEDFVPYYQAMAGTSYRFSENIILEFYLQATTLNDNFDIELDSTAATYYDSSATTTYDEFTYNDVDITFEYDKEITDQIFIYSIVLSYRFLF